MDKFINKWKEGGDSRPKQQSLRQTKINQLKGVHHLETSYICARPADLHKIIDILINPGSTDDELIHSLKKISCYELSYSLLVETQLGRYVVKLMKHPSPRVSDLAKGVSNKLRDVCIRFSCSSNTDKSIVKDYIRKIKMKNKPVKDDNNSNVEPSNDASEPSVL
uniref:TFIIS N-terminal domain-containing protein n=1 Tax=Polytomella parva TaxID=51329 RepID=A0A7S0USA4_9CHLO|mmetsp:Transcript_19856/g.35779  ORF Transcript_19856/g.35779 Transcript_19856/m.35779 type:complete len:165 (+) Transcript_19856:88-582(+)